MLLFLERVVIAVLVGGIIALTFTNPMNLDVPQRISGAIALFAAAFFVAFTITKQNLDANRPTLYEQNSAIEKLGVAGQEFQARLNWVNRGKNTAEDILVLIAWWEDTTTNPQGDSGVLISTSSVPETETFYTNFPISIYKNSPPKFIFSRLRFRDQKTRKYYEEDFYLKVLGADAQGNFQGNIVSVSADEKAAIQKHVEEVRLLDDPRLKQHGIAKR